MEKNILVILMMAFGLFAILMFILFYIYAKKHYNENHINEDYDLEDNEIELVEIIINNKNYLFDSNGYNVEEGNKVRVVINGEVVNGRVIKANYEEPLSKLGKRPEKLILSEEKEEVKSPLNDDMEFVPKKKK